MIEREIFITLKVKDIMFDHMQKESIKRIQKQF